MGGANCPEKNNTQKLRGIEAITGKSNFDISLWMLNALLNALDGMEATLAMLCKTSVARKTLQHAWQQSIPIRNAAIYEINAARLFGASVDASLLLITLGRGKPERECAVYDDLDDRQPTRLVGFEDGRLISRLDAYRRWGHLAGNSPQRWRSGIKHDCAKVMELRQHEDSLRNGLGEVVDIESTYLFPLLKSSHLARGTTEPDRWMLVPQQTVGQDTRVVQERAPKTWRYLMAHADRLDARASTIYRKRPRFSVFGVGDYSFAPWKVAISGFYKRLVFTQVGEFAGKPIVLDDTCYFLACASRAQADELLARLNGPIAQEYYSAFIFWDAKRPITGELLQSLDLDRLRREMETR